MGVAALSFVSEQEAGKYTTTPYILSARRISIQNKNRKMFGRYLDHAKSPRLY